MAPKGPKSILYIVVLHIKSKVMKSRIQWCKMFAPGHDWGTPEIKKYDFGSFFIVTQLLLGFLS